MTTTGDPAAAAEAAALDAYSQIVVGVAERLRPSVASLKVSGARSSGSGSAVAMSADGLLVTSAHVVRDSRGGEAIFVDGTEAAFDVVGADPLSDLAVVRLRRDVPITPAQLGDADELRVGQLVVAIGNPLGFGGSVSAGVVSALGRTINAGDGRQSRIVEDVIQTDAALHPGNSGGALADAAGKVVGINTAVIGPGIGQGLGLAVPVNAHTRRLLGELIAEGRVVRAWLGLGGRSVAAAALEVVSLVEGGPAARAGIRVGDRLLRVGDEPIARMGDLQRLLSGDRVGQPLQVELARAGSRHTVVVVPTVLPS
jgi:S1-C subfamily serine protease